MKQAKSLKILDQIYQKYKPNLNKVRPTVNPNISPTIFSNNFIDNKHRDDIEIAHLICKFKNIYFTEYPDQIVKSIDPLLKKALFIKQNIQNIKKIFYYRYYLSRPNLIQDNFQDIQNNKDNTNKIVMFSDFFKEKRLIMYNKAGEKNALLLLLWENSLNIKEFKEPGSWAESYNPYLIGKLLEYCQQDILFFYYIDGFKRTVTDLLVSEYLAVNPFIKWPQEIKDKFYKFLKLDWDKSESFEILNFDQNQAKNWLNTYKNLSISCLNSNLKNKLKNLKSEISNNLKLF